jgi:hypothetical protein
MRLPSLTEQRLSEKHLRQAVAIREDTQRVERIAKRLSESAEFPQRPRTLRKQDWQIRCSASYLKRSAL